MRWYLKLLPIALLAGAAIYWKSATDSSVSISGIFTYIHDLGWLGMLYFVMIYMVATVCLMPGLVITLAAGFIYGLWVGTLLVSIGSMAGAMIAFFLSRTMMHDWVEKKTHRLKAWSAVQKVIQKNGLKMIALLRLSPVFPFSVLNYFLGITHIKWQHYLLGSWIAMLPGTFLYVYLGSIAKNINQILQGEMQFSSAQNAWLVVGFALTIYIVVWVTKKAKKELELETQKVI